MSPLSIIQLVFTIGKMGFELYKFFRTPHPEQDLTVCKLADAQKSMKKSRKCGKANPRPLEDLLAEIRTKLGL